jgi:chaperonin cofactor prefoldin
MMFNNNFLSDVEKLYAQKQQALSQFNENTLVKGVMYNLLHYLFFIKYVYLYQELDLLVESDKVYKLVGPVLLSVELDESKENVAKRLEFIEAEIKKLDSGIGKIKNIVITVELPFYCMY